MKLRFTALSLVTAALCACVPTPDNYTVGGSSGRLTKSQAEARVVENSLQAQIRLSLDAPLRITRIELPSYPTGWKRLKGVPDLGVRVAFTVSTTGNVIDTVVVGRAHPELAARCLRSMEDWRFEPALRQGKAVELRLIFEFIFRLED